MAVNLSPVGGGAAQFFTNSGVPLTGGKLFTYAAGTTTPQATYTTYQGNVAWTNPIVLDAAGRVPSSGEIWLTNGVSYKFVLKDANDVTIATYDNVDGINDSTAILGDLSNNSDPTKGDALVGFRQSNSSGNLTGAVSRTVHQKFQEFVSVLDFGADSTGLTGASATIQQAFDTVNALGGGAVFFPAGTYLIDANIVLRSNLNIYGAGAASVLKFTGNNRECLTTQGNFVNNTQIHDLYFNGMKPSVGWETTNNFDFGIRLGNAAPSQTISDIQIYNNTFKDVGLDGVYVENCVNVRITNNDYLNCRRWGVVVEPGSHDSQNVLVADSFFSCDNGSGPPGKEYPLGAIDCEPFISNTSVKNLTFRNLESIRGDIQMDIGTGEIDAIRNAQVQGCIVEEGRLTFRNGQYSVQNCRVSGNTRGEFYVDGQPSSSDGAPTSFTDLDVTIDRPGVAPSTVSGRLNLLPFDFGDSQYSTNPVSQSGSGQSNGYVFREIDNQPVWLEEIQNGPTAGDYIPFRANLPVNVAIGDQVYIYLEVERTDNNVATNNFLLARLGTTPQFDRLLLVPPGVSTVSFAFRIRANETTPEFRCGLSGTPGVQVKVLFKKIFFFKNPRRIDDSQFTIGYDPLTKTIAAFTGPDLDAYNASFFNIAVPSAQNLDTINGGYVGARVTIFCSTVSFALTVRSESVGSGNIRLMNNSTQALQFGTSTQALTLVKSSDGYWYQAS
jgi:hypothetical protein